MSAQRPADEQAIADWLAANRPKELPPRVAAADHSRVRRRGRAVRPKPEGEPINSVALGKNVAPSETTEPAVIKRLNRRTTDWLRSNDPQAKAERTKAKRAARKAAHQAKTNPKLVADNRRAVLRGHT